GPERQALAAERRDGRGGLLDGLARDVHHGDVRARPGERQRGRFADAVRGPGDDGNTILEHHVCPLSFTALDRNWCRDSTLARTTSRTRWRARWGIACAVTSGEGPLI